MKRLMNFIDGEFTPPQSGEYFPSYNPATGQPHLEVSDSAAADVDHAVQSAKLAFRGWRRTSAEDRAKFLYRIAEQIESRQDVLAKAESQDQGKPVWLAAVMDIPRVAHNFRFFAGAILHQTELATSMSAEMSNRITRTPVGVTGLISPWNLPLYLLSWKIAPAIAYGNTAVCKPSELTSLTASILCEIFRDVGLPKGVVNMVFGTGPKAGAALVAHPEVPLISFTGGTATGRAIAASASPQFKKLSLELGGKNPNLIFADANYDLALATTVRSSFLNQGEICLCGSRIYVQRKIYDRFLKDFIELAQNLKVGDPSSPQSFLGALVSKEHREKVESYIALARSEGAEVVCGGQRPKLQGAFQDGYFLEATILTNVKQKSRVQQEEIFGPVVTVTPFDTVAEAIELANDCVYGLSATVWTESLSQAQFVSERLEAGTVWVNTWLSRDLRAPFGGVKASGLGREGQNDSLEFFTEAKTICVRHSYEERL